MCLRLHRVPRLGWAYRCHQYAVTVRFFQTQREREAITGSFLHFYFSIHRVPRPGWAYRCFKHAFNGRDPWIEIVLRL